MLRSARAGRAQPPEAGPSAATPRQWAAVVAVAAGAGALDGGGAWILPRAAMFFVARSLNM